MRRALKIGPLMVATVLGLAACGGADTTSGSASTSATQFPMTITNCGRDITFDTQPQRVLTMAADSATLVAAAGAADKIVARNYEFGSPLGEYEPQLKDIKYLSPDQELSKEEIIAQDPDLVIHYGIKTTAEDLEAAGIKSIATPGRCTPRTTQSFDDIFAAIELYGRLLGTEDTAKAAVAGLRARVEAVMEQSKTNPTGRTAAALIFSTEGPLGAYGTFGTIHNQIEALGLKNVFADQNKAYFEVGTESLLTSDPDVLILLSQKIDETPAQVKETLLARTELRKLKAITNDDIIVLYYGDASGGPVAVEGLETMSKQLATLQ